MHCDLKPDNICCGYPSWFPTSSRPLLCPIDLGGCSNKDGSDYKCLGTIEFSLEPMLAAPSSTGQGCIHQHHNEFVAAATTKADVSSMFFVALWLLLGGQLPPKLTLYHHLQRLGPDNAQQAKAALLAARLQACQDFPGRPLLGYPTSGPHRLAEGRLSHAAGPAAAHG